jgi:hypothetical protein
VVRALLFNGITLINRRARRGNHGQFTE